MEVPSVGFCYNKYFTALQGFIYIFFLMNSQVDVRKMWEPVRGSTWKQHVMPDYQRCEGCLWSRTKGTAPAPGRVPPATPHGPPVGAAAVAWRGHGRGHCMQVLREQTYGHGPAVSRRVTGAGPAPRREVGCRDPPAMERDVVAPCWAGLRPSLGPSLGVRQGWALLAA